MLASSSPKAQPLCHITPSGASVMALSTPPVLSYPHFYNQTHNGSSPLLELQVLEQPTGRLLLSVPPRGIDSLDYAQAHAEQTLFLHGVDMWQDTK